MERKDIIKNINNALKQDVNKGATVEHHTTNDVHIYNIENVIGMHLDLNEMHFYLYDFGIELYPNHLIMNLGHCNLLLDYVDIKKWRLI